MIYFILYAFSTLTTLWTIDHMLSHHPYPMPRYLIAGAALLWPLTWTVIVCGAVYDTVRYR